MSLYAVSIDPPAESKVFAERIAADGRGAVRFPLLSDPGHRVIDAYRLRDTAYDGKEYEGIPHPAVYVIDKSGRIRLRHVGPLTAADVAQELAPLVKVLQGS